MYQAGNRREDETKQAPMADKTVAANTNTGGSTDTHVTFEDLRYSVETGKSSTSILRGLTGCFRSGRLSALMGPSGSGKTTLLDCLAGRKNNTSGVAGTILYNGRKPMRLDFRNMVGYVEQFDTLVGELTVEQMLHYTAELKLPTTMTKQDRLARVNQVLQELDLTSCRHTIIGNALCRGISGGQAKRVNIGLALIPRPPILFLDEPTSGLDSRTANEVVELLRSLAHTDDTDNKDEDGHNHQRTIVCTIHSPSGHAFSRFDDLYMIHQGQTMYNGPVVAVQDYFEGQHHVARDPVASLPEWLVDLTSDMDRLLPLHSEKNTPTKTTTPPDFSTKELSSSDFVEAYKSSLIKKQLDQERQELVMAQKEHVSLEKVPTLLSPPSELSKLCTLFKYRTVAHYKDPQFVGPRFGDKAIFALLIMTLYWKIGNDLDPQSVASTTSLFFFIVVKCGFGAASFVPALTLERKLFYRELADGCYAPTTYYLSKFLEEAIIALLTSGFFSLAVFFGCALTGNFGVFFLTYYLTTLLGVVLAYAFSAAFATMSTANTLLPLYVSICLYFGGFVIVFDKIPKGWEWFSWTSFLRYSWGAMMVDNFQDSEPGKVGVFFDSDGNPQTVLEFYGMTEGPIMNSTGACIGLLTTLLVVLAFVGVLCLLYIRHEKR